MRYFYVTKLHLIVSDEEIKDFALGYHSETNEVEKIYDSNNYKTKPFKVIAGLAELPSINILNQQDKDRLGWIDVEGLSKELGLEFYIGGNYDFENGVRKGLQHQLSTKIYSEEDMINAAKYGYEFRDTTSFPEHKFEDSCINNFKQYLQSDQPKLIPIEIEMGCKHCIDIDKEAAKGITEKCESEKCEFQPKIESNQITITKIL